MADFKTFSYEDELKTVGGKVSVITVEPGPLAAVPEAIIIDVYVDGEKQKNEELQKRTDRFGVAGVAIGNYLGYAGTHSLRAGLANVINMSANAYVNSPGAKYPIARGVDFARRASITALSIKDTADKINSFADVGRAYVYASKKKANKE